MKVRQKLTMILLTAGILFFGLCIFFFSSGMKEFYLETAAESYEVQMASMDHAFSEVLSDQTFGRLGDQALEAYLKYQFRRCFGSGYALLRDGRCLVNLTEYELLAPEQYRGPYMIQHLGERAVLLMRQEIGGFEGFQVMLAQDITAYDQVLRQQLGRFILICSGLLLGMTLLVWLILKKVLKPFEVLTETARRLGEGDLKARVQVGGRDELGILGAAFNRMADQVERQVDDLRLLLGALAHEIKTPMTSIIGYGETLLHVKLSREKQEQALWRIVHSGKRMERLSGKMLALLGTYETESIQFQKVPVRDLFEMVREEASSLMEKRGLCLVTEEGWGEKEPVLCGDVELLVSLLLNLVHNGAKASRPGMRIWMGADEGRLWVRDEGEGISEEDLPHVTEAFYMADKSRSRSEGGSGLGLALCLQIARLHGMELLIASKPGQGTTVSLKLPK